MAHVPRIHWPEPLETGQQLTVGDERAHHLLRVLKRRAGDALILFQAPDLECRAEIEAVARHELTVRILECARVQRESPLATRLIQGVSRGDRMDFSIGKCVELGVHEIQPVLSARSGVQLSGSRLARKQAHWQAIALSAAEQSGRTVVPQVLPCLDLGGYLSQSRHGYVLAPQAGAAGAGAAPDVMLDLLIGPEGGLDEAEIELARRSGLSPLALGPRVLRTETAGPAALAWLQARWGDFPGQSVPATRSPARGSR